GQPSAAPVQDCRPLNANPAGPVPSTTPANNKRGPRPCPSRIASRTAVINSTSLPQSRTVVAPLQGKSVPTPLARSGRACPRVRQDGLAPRVDSHRIFRDGDFRLWTRGHDAVASHYDSGI